MFIPTVIPKKKKKEKVKQKRSFHIFYVFELVTPDQDVNLLLNTEFDSQTVS